MAASGVLLTCIGVRLQRSCDAQPEDMHKALPTSGRRDAGGSRGKAAQ